ncbi:hypothetical protein OPS25_04255 [Alteromonas ponticola]|uniref:Uncharacterized protein n=1 Tax=Alteromonas aquimaris TaxID=2998417 RepID=A0ABT3P5C6_9ALTE|nr:hypothetical protein [Alteromonas aquimaris]MCW8107715.1 hypothetical protein [Alteromonas aquimaris]
MNGGGWKGALSGAAMGAAGGFLGGWAGSLWSAGYRATSASVGANTIALAVVANSEDE